MLLHEYNIPYGDIEVRRKKMYLRKRSKSRNIPLHNYPSQHPTPLCNYNASLRPFNCMKKHEKKTPFKTSLNLIIQNY